MLFVFFLCPGRFWPSAIVLRPCTGRTVLKETAVASFRFSGSSDTPRRPRLPARIWGKSEI